MSKFGMIFLSYQRKDKKFALRLKKSLEAEGETVWMDTKIQSGERWVTAIDEALKKSKTLMVVVTPRAAQSDFVEKEVVDALGKLTIVAIIKQKCRWPLINNVQHADFTTWYEEDFARLMDLPVPHRTWWRSVLIFLRKAARWWLFLLLLALVAGGITFRYHTSPSTTSFAFEDADQSAITLAVRNDGGRESWLASGTVFMHFGDLPILPEKLVFADNALKAVRIPGHERISVKLTTARVLTPLQNTDGSWPSESVIKELIPRAKVRITGSVAESGNRTRPWEVPFDASRAGEFIVSFYPTTPRSLYE